MLYWNNFHPHTPEMLKCLIKTDVVLKLELIIYIKNSCQGLIKTDVVLKFHILCIIINTNIV